MAITVGPNIPVARMLEAANLAGMRQSQQRSQQQRRQEDLAQQRFNQSAILQAIRDQENRRDQWQRMQFQNLMGGRRDQMQFQNRMALQDAQNKHWLGVNEQQHAQRMQVEESRKADKIEQAYHIGMNERHKLTPQGQRMWDMWIKGKEDIDSQVGDRPHQKAAAHAQHRMKLAGLLNHIQTPTPVFATHDAPDDQKQAADYVQTPWGQWLHKKTGKIHQGTHPNVGKMATLDDTGNVVPIQPGMFKTVDQLKQQAAMNVGRKVRKRGPQINMHGTPDPLDNPQFVQRLYPEEVTKEYKRLLQEQDRRPRYFYKNDGSTYQDPAQVERWRMQGKVKENEAKRQEKADEVKRSSQQDYNRELMRLYSAELTRLQTANATPDPANPNRKPLTDAQVRLKAMGYARAALSGMPGSGTGPVGLEDQLAKENREKIRTQQQSEANLDRENYQKYQQAVSSGQVPTTESKRMGRGGVMRGGGSKPIQDVTTLNVDQWVKKNEELAYNLVPSRKHFREKAGLIAPDRSARVKFIRAAKMAVDKQRAARGALWDIGKVDPERWTLGIEDKVQSLDAATVTAKQLKSLGIKAPVGPGQQAAKARQKFVSSAQESIIERKRLVGGTDVRMTHQKYLDLYRQGKLPSGYTFTLVDENNNPIPYGNTGTPVVRVK